MIKNLLSFKIKINKINTLFFIFFGDMLGPYINPGAPGPPKSHQMQPSSQWRHMYNKGKQFENQFFIHEPKCKQKCIFWAI